LKACRIRVVDKEGDQSKCDGRFRNQILAC